MADRTFDDRTGRIARGIDEALLTAHDMAMHEQEQLAVAGRILKQILPAFEAAIKAEGKRGTPPLPFALASCNVASTVIVSMLAYAAREPANLPSLIDQVAPVMQRRLDAMATKIRQQVEEP